MEIVIYATLAATSLMLIFAGSAFVNNAMDYTGIVIGRLIRAVASISLFLSVAMVASLSVR